MSVTLFPETNTQFLARMILSTREQHQINSSDARRLGDLAQFGPGGPPTTMPEERRQVSKPLSPKNDKDLVAG
jgi:hypothetical protein